MIAGAGGDGDRIAAGLGGAHAAVGGEVGEALVVELEQQPGGDVMGIGGQRERAALGFAGQRQACSVQAA